MIKIVPRPLTQVQPLAISHSTGTNHGLSTVAGVRSENQSPQSDRNLPWQLRSDTARAQAVALEGRSQSNGGYENDLEHVESGIATLSLHTSGNNSGSANTIQSEQVENQNQRRGLRPRTGGATPMAASTSSSGTTSQGTPPASTGSKPNKVVIHDGQGGAGKSAETGKGKGKGKDEH